MKIKYLWLLSLLFLFVSPWVFSLSVHNMVATGLFTEQDAKGTTVCLQIFILIGFWLYAIVRY